MHQDFFLISLSSLHINDVTIPIFESEGRKQETELGYGSYEFKPIRVRLHLTKSASWNIEIEVERTRIYFSSEAFAAVAILGYLINSLLSGCWRRVQATKWDTVEWPLLHLLLPIMFVVQDETIPKAKEKWRKYLTPTTNNNNIPWVYKAPLRLLHFPWRFFPGEAQ